MNVIFFDGICIMCNDFVNFISERDSQNIIFFCDIRSEKAKSILLKNNFKIESIETIIFLNGDKILFKSDAIIEILISLNKFYKILSILKILPKKTRDYFYDQVSKRRRFFGEKDDCKLNYKIHKKIIY
jgi:predicted DCC family thiol-disulfide oxidoreductase YuxK